MATIASMMVSLGLDGSGLRRGFGRSSAAVSDFGAEVDQVESKLEGFADTAKTAAAGAAAAIGGALAKGIANNINLEQSRATLAAQLGLSTQDAAKAGKLAGSLYREGWGENLDGVNAAVRGVITNMNAQIGSVNLKPLTRQAMILSDVFGADVAESTRAAGQLMRNLGTDGKTAMDLITKVMQTGGDRAEDLLDTLTEYSPMFAQVGLSGKQAMGIINQGLQAGARNTDLVADAIKEFGIRARDGSKLTAEGFKAVGLNAEQMAAQIAQGGPAAAAAMDMTLDRLRAMEDPVKRDAAAVALFGTQAEDLGDSLYALDPSQAAASLGQFAGATQRAGQVASDTAQNKITQLQRQFNNLLTQAAALPGPLGMAGAAVAAFGGSALAMAGPAAQMVASFVMVRGASNTTRTSMIKTAAVWVAQWIRMAVVSLAQAARMAAAWLIAMGPIGWAIAAILGLVALIIANWDKVKKWTKQAWNAVVGWVTGAWDWIVGVVTGAGRKVVDLVKGAWQSAKDWAIRKATQLINWVKGLPGRLLGALGDLGALLVDAGRSIIQGLWNGIKAMGTWLKNKILGFIRSFVPGPVLRFLGISSPSRLFADIGSEIPAGLAQGILGGTGQVARAAARMAGDTVPDLPALRGAAGGGRGQFAADLSALLSRAITAALSHAPINVHSELNVDGKRLAAAVEQGLLELAVRR